MQIVANLTAEQELILAKAKGYSSEVGTFSADMLTVTNSPNPQSSSDFLKEVYENMLKEDMAKILIAHSDEVNRDKKIAREQAIRDSVVVI